MSYQLVYTQQAVKDIRDLDRIVQKRLAKKLEHLRIKPLALSKPLIHSKLGQYRYRIGDYRVIFDLDKNNLIILRVGHRREIYR